MLVFNVELRNQKQNFHSENAPVIAQSVPERGSLFSRIQNHSESMTQNVLARSASRTGKKLISKIADKARKIKSSGNWTNSKSPTHN